MRCDDFKVILAASQRPLAISLPSGALYLEIWMVMSWFDPHSCNGSSLVRTIGSEMK